MFSGIAQVSHQVCQVFVSSVCLLVLVTAVDKNKAVVCCLLATSETVGFFPEWTVQFSVWMATGKDSSEACAIACQNCAVSSVFMSGM